MRTHCTGFPVSGSQGMGNRETASISLILIGLMLPGEVATWRMPGKPICQLSARDSGHGRQDRAGDTPLKFLKPGEEFGSGRIVQVSLAGTGGADIAVVI